MQARESLFRLLLRRIVENAERINIFYVTLISWIPCDLRVGNTDLCDMGYEAAKVFMCCTGRTDDQSGGGLSLVGTFSQNL
jgi:hypothetical protein